MISNTDAQSLIQASFFFNELFKRTVLSAPLPVSVTKTQMDILMALYSDGPMNMSTLSAKVYIAPEQATRAIHGLREKGSSLLSATKKIVAWLLRDLLIQPFLCLMITCAI